MIEIIPNWHPVAVHFAIALLVSATALFMLATAFANRPIGAAATLVARWNLALGILATALTLATGWQAYNTVAHDEPSHINMTIHLRWALGAGALFLASGAAAWLDRRRIAGAGIPLLLLATLGSATLAVTGWLGGENVYRFGLGVMSLPQSDAHVHPAGAAGQTPKEHQHGATGSTDGGAAQGAGNVEAKSVGSSTVPPAASSGQPVEQHEHAH